MSNTTPKHWLYSAMLEDPDGITCGFCGKPNDFADDIGWFYVKPFNKLKPCCYACYNSWAGYFHTKKYGIGDR